MAKIERTKNASRNILFGVILRIYQILIPFLMRTAMIYFMGVQYLGLNSLFSSVLQVLNLAELGVGSAMVYSMYKPIAEDDEITICALMQLYKIYYRIIGLVIAGVGCAITPFIPRLIKGEVPDGVSIYVLYLLNLGVTVLSYWLFAYKNSVLIAHQRTDIISKVTLVTSSFQYFIQFLILVFLKNYYLFVITALITQALTNIVTAIVSKRIYPQFKAKGKLETNKIRVINKRIRDLFTSKIGAVIVNSADTIVISAFLGLIPLAIYQNYFYILTSVIGFITVIFNSCTAGIGNSLVVESKDKNLKDLRKFTFLISWIACICACCFLNLFQPFMIIWVGKDYLLPNSAVICLVLYYYIYEINQLLNLYKDAGGIWHEDKFRPLVTAMTNLVLNIIMVRKWGLYGVLLSTVLSMLFVGMPWILYNLFTTLFDKSCLRQYLSDLIKYSMTTFLCCLISAKLCTILELSLIFEMIIRLVISIVIPMIVFYFAFNQLQAYTESLVLIDNITNGKLKLAKRCKDRPR